MREEEANWFFKWEEDLPSPEELTPLSQTLITPDLAIAFNIQNPGNTTPSHPPPPPPPPPVEFGDSTELVSSSAGGSDEPARTLKRPRLVWTPQLHKRFVDAVAQLGIKNAVPKTIMQLMSVDGLTRENVASHLQKYRLYLKRMQGQSNGTGGKNAGSASADPATDHLFASAAIPPHFLNQSRANSEHFLPYVNVAAMQQHMAVHPQLQPQFHRPIGNFGSQQNGQFEQLYMSRQSQQPVHRMGVAANSAVGNYVEELESLNGEKGRKVLTLFPTGDD